MLYPLIEQVVAEKRLKSSDPSLSIEFKESLKLYSAFVWASSVEFKRGVLSNLLENAIEACEGKDQKKITLTILEENNTTLLKIRDNGKGIPKHKITEIFERGKSFDKARGTGLGLYHAKNYLEATGNRIELESF